MDEKTDLAFSNVNSKWMENMFENIVSSEKYLIIAQVGWESSEELVLPLSADRQTYIKYNALKKVVFEIDSLITDAGLPLGEQKQKEFILQISPVVEIINTKDRFIKYNFSEAHNQVTEIKLTKEFYNTLDYIKNLRRRLLHELGPVLYAQDKKDDKLWQISSMT